MDFGDALELCGSGTYEVRRPAPTVLVNGRRLPPQPAAVLYAQGTLFPLTGQDLERLPEGLRNSETRALITETVLRVAEGPQEADQVVIDGQLWQVSNVADWQELGGFTRAILTRPKA